MKHDDSSPNCPPAGEPVVIGLSGGVDSAVAALLLKRSGYRPVGVTLWLSGEGEEPPPSARDAAAVARHLEIEHHVLDLRKEFAEQVVDAFVREHWNGRTPNPCVGCNARVKWGMMRQWGIDRGMPWFTTGHYVHRVVRDGEHYLARAADLSKDQSYFLWMLSSQELSYSLFPLHGLSKSEVRAIAAEEKLPVAVKSDSQDVCFLPEGERLSLLRKRGEELGLLLHPGEICDLHGKVIGTHQGLPLYTRGQRQGLGVATGERVWVKEIDYAENSIKLGRREELYGKSLVVEECRWHLPPEFLIESGEELTVQLRYRTPEILCQLSPEANGRWRVDLDAAAWAITPGQSAVFRIKERDLRRGGLLVGGGVISAS